MSDTETDINDSPCDVGTAIVDSHNLVQSIVQIGYFHSRAERKRLVGSGIRPLIEAFAACRCVTTIGLHGIPRGFTVIDNSGVLIRRSGWSLRLGLGLQRFAADTEKRRQGQGNGKKGLHGEDGAGIGLRIRI